MRRPADRPRNAVLVVAAQWDGAGGLQQQLHHLVEVLAADHHVVVLTWRGWRSTLAPSPNGNARVLRAPALWDWQYEMSPARGQLNALVTVVTGLLAALWQRRRWTVVVGGGLHPDGFVAALAAQVRRSPFVIRTWLVGPLGNVSRLRAARAGPFVRRVLLRAYRVVTETEEGAEELAAVGFRPERVQVVPDGLDLSRWVEPTSTARRDARSELGLPIGPGIAVYCGRFDLRQKRLDVLIEGWKLAGLDGWHLIVAGDGPDRPTVHALAARCDGSVSIRGWIDDPRPLLLAADLFVLPTEAETTALAMLEGMACEIPGIVTATTGMSRRRPEGVTLVANRAEDWAGALTELALDDDRRLRAGRDARRWVRSHHDRDNADRAWRRIVDAAQPD